RGLAADEVLPLFIAGLKHDQASIRRQSIESIALFGRKAGKVGPELVAALDDPDDNVRRQALSALQKVGANPKTMLPAMIKLLKSNDATLREEAAQVVYQAGPEAAGDLVVLLKKGNPSEVRLVGLRALAMLGPPAKDALPDLIQALGAPEATVRMTAARALGNL